MSKLIASRNMRIIIFLSMAAVLVPLAAIGCGASQPAAQGVVKKVDHVTISSVDPEALFNMFTQTLGLPVAWPFSSYPGFVTGGTFAGNVNIETLCFGNPGQPESGSPTFTSYYGIVFESYPLSDVTDEFQQRGAAPSDPVDQMREVNGQQVKVWTNVILGALCTDQYIVYLCEYTPQMQEKMEDAQSIPGPLGGIGLVGVKEIVVSSTQPQQTRQLWETVFAPAPMSEDGLLSFDSGPSIRISEGSTDVIKGLVLEVASLDIARDFLAQNGLLGQASGDQLSIDPAKVQGLDIRLVEES